MKRSKFAEAQIAFMLRQAEEGAAVAEVSRTAGISDATFYNWKKRYGGLTPWEVKRMRQLEDENRRLKKIVVGLTLGKAMLQDVVRRKRWGLPAGGGLRIFFATAFACGAIGAKTLRSEAGGGNLTITRMGGKDYVTPADIRQMRSACPRR